jgi:hypothetical protein
MSSTTHHCIVAQTCGWSAAANVLPDFASVPLVDLSLADQRTGPIRWRCSGCLAMSCSNRRFKKADNHWAEIKSGKVSYRIVGMPDAELDRRARPGVQATPQAGPDRARRSAVSGGPGCSEPLAIAAGVSRR